jgi:hypothetical protein
VAFVALHFATKTIPFCGRLSLVLVSPFESHSPVVEDGTKAVAQLAEVTGLNQQHIKQVMQKGAVWLTNK